MACDREDGQRLLQAYLNLPNEYINQVLQLLNKLKITTQQLPNFLMHLNSNLIVEDDNNDDDDDNRRSILKFNQNRVEEANLLSASLLPLRLRSTTRLIF